VHTVETATENKRNMFIRSHLWSILLIGKEEKEKEAEESDKKKINSNYNSMDDIDQLQIYNPLQNWTKKDIWTFASSLYLPYKLAT